MTHRTGPSLQGSVARMRETASADLTGIDVNALVDEGRERR
jgi:hypothetical protein